ncbi:MAG TPA: hypothetical protein VJU61_11335, partial [Polyangiaceae bacterium]|nr:hypothetical protein [Polyangiaceae bacterium]
MRDVVPFPIPRVFGLCLIGCLLALGCAKQGVGERCDQNNADLDCEPGLVCRGEAQLSIKGRGIALCCPIGAGAATVDVCRAGSPLPSEMLPEPSVDAG